MLLGASLTVGGLDCPAPEQALGYLVLAFGSAAAVFSPLFATTTTIAFSALFAYYPRPRGHAYTSLRSMTLLLYGAFIPTLAMVNFAQSILLASFAHVYLHLYSFLGLDARVRRWARIVVVAATMPPTVLSILKAVGKVDLEEEWQVGGNLGWVGVYVVWVPLWILGVMLMRERGDGDRIDGD